MEGKLVITDPCKHYSYDQWTCTDSSTSCTRKLSCLMT